jgi:LmbE family N-acetylglucosaminyl deacetylase
MKYFSLAVCLSAFLLAQPKILIVNAHPDDESGCAATIYKITHDLKGTVDLCLVTNGEAGFKYSTLAEEWYGLELTDETIGRANLPRIRKQEMMNAGKVIGLRIIYFLDFQDQRYTTDISEVLTKAWDEEEASKRIGELIAKGNYDYVFCILPTPDQHGGHKAASYLTLREVSKMKTKRPIVLGVGFGRDTTRPIPVTLDSLSITKLKPNTKPFLFNRAAKFGFNDRLSYKIVTNWLVAEHKSQGALQAGTFDFDYETFWYYDINDLAGIEKTQKLFDALNVIHYKKKSY